MINKKKLIITIIGAIVGVMVGIYLFYIFGIYKLVHGYTYFEIKPSSDFAKKIVSVEENSTVINLAEIEQSDWDTAYFIFIGYIDKEDLRELDGVDNRYNAIRQTDYREKQIVFVKDKIAIKGYLAENKIDLSEYKDIFDEEEYVKVLKVTRENAIFDIIIDEKGKKWWVPTKDFEVFTYGETLAQRDNHGNIIQEY